MSTKKYQVIVAWNREAAHFASTHGLKSALRKSRTKQNQEGDEPFTMGVFTFNTKEEADAFRMGIAEGNGWDDPHYETYEI